MANPDSKDTFLRAINRQAQKVAEAASHHVRQAQQYIQEKQDQVHQNQRELGGKLQKSYQEFQAQWQRKDAAQAFRDSDGTNLFKPVLDAAKSTYEVTAAHEVQEMVEDGRKSVEKKAGDAIGEGLKQANRSFRQGLRDAAPTLQAIDRNIGQFDRDVHHALPGAPRLSEVSNAINQQRQRNREAVHEFLMRKDVPAEWSQQLQSASRFMTAKGEHAKYYSDATGLTTTAGYVQDIDLLHSVGKGGLKMARIPQDRALWDARKVEELKEFQALRQPHAPVPPSPETIAKRIEDADRRVAEQAAKPHNLLEPAHVQSASEAAARDSAMHSMRGVNPDGGEKNCLACVMATYDRHHGIPTSTFVNPGGAAERGARPIDLSILKTHFQSEWQQVHGLNEISSQLGKEGRSGVLWFSQGDKAHLINVANVDGHVVLMDSQSGKLVSPRSLPEIRVEADGSTNFKFMPTPPPRNYQGIPPHGSIETLRHRIVSPDGTERLVTDAEVRRIVAEPAGPPRHTLIGADGQARPATDWETRQAIRDATPRNRIIGADGKVSLATDEEVRRGLQAAARPHAPEGGTHPPQNPDPTTGSAGAYPPGPHEPPRAFGMRPQDQEIFAEAARRQQRWIVVRETNPEALKYIGQPGYTPKPFECKAKSANVPEHKYAGLVVDPKRHPSAFQDPAAASAEWDKMLARTKGDARFAVDRSGRLRFEGKQVHSDYDIYDVIHPDRPVNLSPVGMQGGQPVFETRGLPPVRDYVNKQVGSEVIQHPAEAQFKGHSDQRLIVFGPNGERFVTDGKQAIEDVYKERFPGRYALDQSRSADLDNVAKFPKLRAVEAQPPDPLKTPISRDELWRQGVQNQRGFRSSPSGLEDRLRKEPAKVAIDPEGVGPRVGKGFETFGAIQVLDKNGQRVEVGSGMFRGGGPENHAEALAIRGLEQNGPAKVEGGRMMVVVDQDPCPNCRQRILDYAQSRGIQEIEVHVPTRESLANGDRDVSPKTAAVTSFQGDRPPVEFNTEVWSPSGEVVSSSKARDAREFVARAAQTSPDAPAAEAKSQPSSPESGAPKTAGEHTTPQPDPKSQPSPAESPAAKTADQHAVPQPDPKPQPKRELQSAPAESAAPRTASERPTPQPETKSQPEPKSRLAPAESAAPQTADQHSTPQPDAKPQPGSKSQLSPAESVAPRTAGERPEAKSQLAPAESTAPRTADQHSTHPPDAKPQPEPKSQLSPAESTKLKTAGEHVTPQPEAKSQPEPKSQLAPTGSVAPEPKSRSSRAESAAPKTADPQPDAKPPSSPRESSSPKTADQQPARQPSAQRSQAESSPSKGADQRLTSPDAPKLSHTRDLGEAPPPSPAKSSGARDLGEQPQAPAAAKASKTRDLGEGPQLPQQEKPPTEAPAKTPKTRDLGEDPNRQETPRPGERLSSNDRTSAADDMKRKSGRDETSGDKHSAGGIKSSSGHGDAPVEKRSAVDEMRRKSGRDEGQPPAPTHPAPSKDQRPPKS